MVPGPVKSCIMLTADVPPAAFSACVSNNTACGSRCGTWLSWVDGCWLPTDLTIRTKITEKTTKRDKPLRGRWCCGRRVGLTDHPRCCLLESSCKPLCESMERLLTAANSISQRSIHDFSTTPHDRGHANPQPSSEYAKVLHPTGLAIRAVLPEVARTVGAGADSGLPALFDE